MIPRILSLIKKRLFGLKHNKANKTDETIEIVFDVKREVRNMYIEWYNDARLFNKIANECKDDFEKRRYFRAVAIFYVISLDLWLSTCQSRTWSNKKCDGNARIFWGYS